MTNANKILKAIPENILASADILRSGGLVAFPTETVYGLAANALDEKAVARIFEAKTRLADKPLIIFVSNFENAKKFAKFSPLAEKLADHFWPGALTLVLDRALDCNLAPNVSAGFKTIGVRVPGNQTALALTKALSFPLAVTSVNLSGHPSPLKAQEITLAVDVVLDGGASELGIESTVIDATGETPVFLREGATSRSEIEGFLGTSL
ncbi:MAG: L-threonylcarbamoyladenylate synthase [Sphingomonadales bacterium]